MKFSARGDIRAATIACMPNTDVDKVILLFLVALLKFFGIDLVTCTYTRNTMQFHRNFGQHLTMDVILCTG